MSQRGEGLFVAMRTNRIHDPREVVGLARDLKIVPALALAYVMLWEAFVLDVGDSLTGRIKGYRADHVAGALTFRSDPARLIAAMKRAGILGETKRGTFFHPYWAETVTGRYARWRAERRDYESEKKRRQRDEREQGGGASNGHSSVPNLSLGTTPGQTENSRGQPGDYPGKMGDQGRKEGRKEGVGPGSPPNPPAKPGGVGFARWEQIRKLFYRPMNPEGCVMLLEAMSDEKWALCLWVVVHRDKEGLSSLSLKKKAFRLDSFEFLRRSAFLQFEPEHQKKLSQSPPVALHVEQAENDQKNVERVRRLILAQLEDPAMPKEEKAEKLKLWLSANPDQAEWLKGAIAN